MLWVFLGPESFKVVPSNFDLGVSKCAFLCSLIGGETKRSGFADQLAPFLDRKASKGREHTRLLSEIQRRRQPRSSDLDPRHNFISNSSKGRIYRIVSFFFPHNSIYSN